MRDLIGNSSPLIFDDASEVRKQPIERHALARAAAVGRTAFPSSSVLLGSQCATPSVAVRPGAMQLTLMLYGPQQEASDFVKFITPAFAAPYCIKAATSDPGHRGNIDNFSTFLFDHSVRNA